MTTLRKFLHLKFEADLVVLKLIGKFSVKLKVGRQISL